MNGSKAEYLVFTKRLYITAEVFGRELSDLGVGACFKALQDLDINAILKALDIIERDSKFWPTPAVIREVVAGGARALLPPEERRKLDEQDRTARSIGFRDHADYVERLRAGIGSHDPWPAGHPKALPPDDPDADAGVLAKK